MSVEELKNKVKQLENDLKQKNEEINAYLDRIDHLENNVIKLENVINEAKKEGEFDFEKIQDTKLTIELEEKNKEIRELKDKMGFLRKEKIQFQKELEQLKRESAHESTVIRIEDKEDTLPFDTLVKELQSKINKQQTLIEELRADKKSDIKEQDLDILQEKNKKIDNLERDIENLTIQLNRVKSQSRNKESESLSSSLTEELQEKLNRSRRQLLYLKNRLKEYENVDDLPLLNLEELDQGHTSSKVQKLRRELAEKTAEINQLRKALSRLKAQKEPKQSSEAGEQINKENISSLSEDLQLKLNMAKIRIASLETQLQEIRRDDREKELPKNEYVKTLQKKMRDKTEKLIIKQEEIETIKNEAIQCNYEITHLKEELKSKNTQIENLESQINEFKTQKQYKKAPKYSQLINRIEELKNIVNELKRQNAEQRVQIFNLKKS